MKHMKKFLVLALVALSIFAVAIPAMAVSGKVDSSHGSTPGGTVNYYSNYNANSTSSSGLTKKGSLSNGNSIDVQPVSGTAHWYSTTINGHTRYILRQFVRVNGSEWEIRYGTMELNLGCPHARYVRLLQQDLKDLKYNITKVDGKFGVNTRSAVEEFQRDYKLSVDGRAGPATKAKLYTVR